MELFFLSLILRSDLLRDLSIIFSPFHHRAGVEVSLSLHPSNMLLLSTPYIYVFLSGDGNDDGGSLKYYLIVYGYTLTLRNSFAGCLSYPLHHREG